MGTGHAARARNALSQCCSLEDRIKSKSLQCRAAWERPDDDAPDPPQISGANICTVFGSLQQIAYIQTGVSGNSLLFIRPKGPTGGIMTDRSGNRDSIRRRRRRRQGRGFALELLRSVSHRDRGGQSGNLSAVRRQKRPLKQDRRVQAFQRERSRPLSRSRASISGRYPERRRLATC